MHCCGKVRCVGQVSHERGIGGKKAGLESISSHVQSFGAVVFVEPFLPCHAISIEGAAKIEKKSLNGVLLHRPCAGI